jgi:hypothetical protein
MGLTDILFSPGGARGTRESVRQAFKRALQQHAQDTPVRRRLNAAFDTLTLRYKVIRKAQRDEFTAIETFPFAWLDNDFEAERTLAEYVVYQEHPRDADRQFVEDATWEGFANLMKAEDADALQAKSNLRIAYPHLSGVLWTRWIDVSSKTEIEITNAAAGRTRSAPTPQAQAISDRVRQVAISLAGGPEIVRTQFLIGYVAGFPNFLEDSHEEAGGVLRAMLFDAMWGQHDAPRLFQQMISLANAGADAQLRRGNGFGIPDGTRWLSTASRSTGPDESLESLRSAIDGGFVDLSQRL